MNCGRRGLSEHDGKGEFEWWTGGWVDAVVEGGRVNGRVVGGWWVRKRIGCWRNGAKGF